MRITSTNLSLISLSLHVDSAPDRVENKVVVQRLTRPVDVEGVELVDEAEGRECRMGGERKDEMKE